jgi:hypothetical protein
MAGHRRIAWESIAGKPFVRAAVTTKILFFWSNNRQTLDADHEIPEKWSGGEVAR